MPSRRHDFVLKAAALLLPVLALAACGSTEPYFLGRWTPGDTSTVDTGGGLLLNQPETGRPYFSVCYSKLLHKPEQVLALVRQHCGDPQLTRNKTDLYACAASAPVRATYSCSGLSRTAEEARPNLAPSGSFLGDLSLY